jgi:ammonia channel protein AmtB
MTGPQDPYAPPPGDQVPAAPVWGPPAAPRPYGTAYPAATRNGLGTVALVLGIVSLPAAFTVIGGVALGIAAVVLGVLGRRRVKRREADNSGAATAGMVLGILGIVGAVAFGAFLATVLNSNSGKQLRDCLDRATNPAQAQQCRVQFEKNYRG